MKLAIKIDSSGSNPLGGKHYMLHPFPMINDREAAIFYQMGYVIIEVENDRGMRMIESAKNALQHQIEVAYIAETQGV